MKMCLMLYKITKANIIYLYKIEIFKRKRKPIILANKEKFLKMMMQIFYGCKTPHD